VSSLLKWLAILVVLCTSLILPLLFLEGQSNRITEQAIAWANSQPLTLAVVLVLALAADVFLPVPNGVINTLVGSVFGWSVGALIIWLGLCLGCMVAYVVGRYAGAPLAQKIVGREDLQKAHETAERLGAPLLVVTRTVPMFAELIAITAGITQYPFVRFLWITSLANLGVAIVFAGIGSAASETQSGLLAFAGAVVLPLLAWLAYRYIWPLFSTSPGQDQIDT